MSDSEANQPGETPPPAKPETGPAKKSPFPRRPQKRLGAVKSGEEEYLPRSTLRLKDLDEENEGELEAALAGLSCQALAGGEQRAAKGPGEAGKPGEKSKVMTHS